MEKRLSIIIPVYNAEKTLRRCLDSILCQSFRDYEIILVDDGSSDNSWKICLEYQNRDKRVYAYRKENGGAGSARKYAALRSKGEYITCIDSDDWIENDSFDKLFAIIDEFHPEMIASSFKKDFLEYETIRDDYLDEGIYSKEELVEIIPHAYEQEQFFCPIINTSLCCKLVQRDLFIRNQICVPNDIVMGEDLAVVASILFEVNSLYICKRAYYHYCPNKNSTTWKWKKGEYQKYKILSEYLLKKKNVGSGYRKEIVRNALFFTLMEILYDVPKDYFKNGIPFLPKIKKSTNIVLYGKGSFGENLKEVIIRNEICNIVQCVDTNDSYNLFSLDSSLYDYVFIAVLDGITVNSINKYLRNAGIEQKKILTIENCNISFNLLPFVKNVEEVL